MCSTDLRVEEAPTGELVARLSKIAAKLADRPAPESAAECLELTETLAAAIDHQEAALAGLVAVVDAPAEAQRWGLPVHPGLAAPRLGMREARAKERLTLARSGTASARSAPAWSTGDCPSATPPPSPTPSPAWTTTTAPPPRPSCSTWSTRTSPPGKSPRPAAASATSSPNATAPTSPPTTPQRGYQRSWIDSTRSLDGGRYIKGWLNAEDAAHLGRHPGATGQTRRHRRPPRPARAHRGGPERRPVRRAHGHQGHSHLRPGHPDRRHHPRPPHRRQPHPRRTSPPHRPQRRGVTPAARTRQHPPLPGPTGPLRHRPPTPSPQSPVPDVRGARLRGARHPVRSRPRPRLGPGQQLHRHRPTRPDLRLAQPLQTHPPRPHSPSPNTPTAATPTASTTPNPTTHHLNRPPHDPKPPSTPVVSRDLQCCRADCRW